MTTTSTLPSGSRFLAGWPFRIAGNLYYVGANDVTSFLLSGPEGHVLIRKLSRHRPDDHGEYREAWLQHPRRQSAAQLARALRPRGRSGGAAEGIGSEQWISEADADIVHPAVPRIRPRAPCESSPSWASPGTRRYPAPRIDHRFKDGATIRLQSTQARRQVHAADWAQALRRVRARRGVAFCSAASFRASHSRIARRTCSLSLTPSRSRTRLRPARSWSSSQKLNRCFGKTRGVHTNTPNWQEIRFEANIASLTVLRDDQACQAPVW
jgi:hypothetical protein